MKVKLAIVGLAHFLMQSPQVQQKAEVNSKAGESSGVAVQSQSKERLPDTFEQKLIDSKQGSVIASPSHETSGTKRSDSGKA